MPIELRVANVYSMMPPTTGDNGGVNHGARPDQAVDRRLARQPTSGIDVGVVGDQSGRPVDLLHDRVAGIDAQPALNTAQLDAVADVDAGRADIDALMAIDAVAGRGATRETAALGFLDEVRGSPRSRR